MDKMKTKKEHEELSKQADKTDDDLKMVAEILKSFPGDKYIIKRVCGSCYLVHCKKSIDKTSLKVGTRLALDFTTLKIIRILPH